MNYQDEISENIQFQALTEEYLEQAVHLTYHSFKKMNPLWNKIPSTYEEMRIPISRRLSRAMEQRTTYIALKHKKVISSITVMDLKDFKSFREEESNQTNPTLLNFLSQIQSKYVSEIFLEKKLQYEECLFGFYGGVDEQYRHPMVFFEMWRVMQADFLQRGYKYIYGFITNPRMFEISKPNLVENEYHEIDIQSQEFPQVNGYKIYFVKHVMKQLIPKPSL